MAPRYSKASSGTRRADSGGCAWAACRLSALGSRIWMPPSSMEPNERPLTHDHRSLRRTQGKRRLRAEPERGAAGKSLGRFPFSCPKRAFLRLCPEWTGDARGRTARSEGIRSQDWCGRAPEGSQNGPASFVERLGQFRSGAKQLQTRSAAHPRSGALHASRHRLNIFLSGLSRTRS